MVSDATQEKRILCTGKVFADFVAIRLAPAPQADKTQTDKTTQGKLPSDSKDKGK